MTTTSRSSERDRARDELVLSLAEAVEAVLSQLTRGAESDKGDSLEESLYKVLGARHDFETAQD